MSNKTAVIVSLSFGTGCIVLFSVIVLASSVAFIHATTPSSPKHSIVPSAPVIPRSGTSGDAETKEQQLNRELGPVNRAKLQEAKTGLLSRIANRRARSSSCTSTSRTTIVRTSSGCSGSTITPPSVAPSPIDPAIPFPGEPMGAPTTPKKREIDPNTCFDGSCALKNSTKSGPIAEDFPPLFD